MKRLFACIGLILLTISASAQTVDSLPVIANMAALCANTGPGQQSALLGYDRPADGGGGSFVFVPTDTTSADNGGTIIVDAAGHRWYRQTADETPDVMWFGAHADATNPDETTVAFNRAIASGGLHAVIRVPCGYFRLNAPLRLSSRRDGGDGRDRPDRNKPDLYRA